jgi:medium-chain acyl-[acyl-carrier-protein] hydrolase
MATSFVSPSIWFEGFRPRKSALLRLFCCPPAGGNAFSFSAWERILPSAVEVFPVQLPGRGGRLGEEPFRRLMSLVQVLSQELLPFLDRPYVLFGHSMGALISFELARHFERLQKDPALLILSGRRSAEWPRSKPTTFDLPDEEFKDALRDMNGTPEEVLNNSQLMELTMPMLRADFELVQTYRFEGPCNLRCPIRVYGGLGDDSVVVESLKAWRQYTRNSFSLSMFPGDHFFVFQRSSGVLQKLALDLESLMAVRV